MKRNAATQQRHRASNLADTSIDARHLRVMLRGWINRLRCLSGKLSREALIARHSGNQALATFR
jgi:hypothetical protein